MQPFTSQIVSSSFRDPAGYVFFENGTFKRAVTQTGRADYDLLMLSGLYAALVERGLLLRHAEENRALHSAPGTPARAIRR
jgi:hypothetical protein